MDISDLLDNLNDVQREAVAAPPGNMLIVAGAGSGKTRVLAHRIAYLIRTGEASAQEILAVTFTNKAARSMRERIEGMLDMPVRQMWVGTFHGIAHRLLRAHWQEAGLPQGFQILDSDDQLRTVKRVLRSMELDEARWPAKQAQWFINGQKDEGRRPQHIDHHNAPYELQMVKIYAAYEEVCKRSGLVDFAELLLRPHETLLRHPDLLKHYQRRFRHILVDEFQDTNTIQYAWLKLLASSGNPMFAVGDDDQSIYGWRGARIENIQRYTDDFANTQTVRLEQNYRSTGNILNAANALIAKNDDRLGKNLWTEDSDGEPILLYAAFNDLEEARYIISNIETQIDRGTAKSEIAILYRSNAQSRVLESALQRAEIPYRIYGGMRFFERAEIKDATAYLRLLSNPDDDASFERVVNTPTRGIGERSVQMVRDVAKQNSCSLWQAAHDVIDNKRIAARSANALHGFISLIEKMTAVSKELELFEKVEHMLQASNLLATHQADKTEKGAMRAENLDELITAARQFENEEEELSELDAFLAHAALEAGEKQSRDGEEGVQLMTLHTAKGLEFDVVYLSGLEEGLFPHRMSLDEPGRLEEERRLCYVGMTRAKQQLCISYAEIRRLHGQEQYTQASRFLNEIPAEYLREVRARASHSPSSFAGRSNDSGWSTPQQLTGGFQMGQRVNHAKFGEGVVTSSEGDGAHARVQVNFSDVGSKWLVIAYANLQAV
ncbi:DNA helicase II [Sulfuriflexus sp.]|uniref:DNA helicase II n=1 Tax=Sulfuriflexus sp. TaxID=2015443 RepID=UPI0028CF6506|nr:DNA helicase II [Sulfuriflexus sp.]MDT8404433.1 DNA helicase II [Sulfuriflexus sp.]